MWLRWVVVAVLILPQSAFAGEALTISTTRVDPHQTCGVLEGRLPKSIESLRKVGELSQAKVAVTTDYDCDHKQGGCEVHVLEFPGLQLDLLVSGNSGNPWVMRATVSSQKWRLFETIYVGQSLDVLETHYGAEIPRGKSPVVLQGECTPLTVWHHNGHVTKLALDCQACY